MSIEPTPKSAVFFWARLGGGHKTAKDAIKEELKENFHNIDTSADIDITGDRVLNRIWLPFIGRLGDYGADSWNNAQKAGNLAYLRLFASLGWIGELLMYPIVYFRVKKILEEMKTEPSYIVSTQAFCLNAIAQAVRSVNREKNWHMHIDVYLTDLPSKKATHFFPSIKRVSGNPRLRDLVCLHSPKPLLKSGQTEKSFWKTHVGDVRVIPVDHYPIRRAFLQTEQLAEKLTKPVVTIGLRLNRPSERDVLDRSIGCAPTVPGDATYPIAVKNEDKVGFLMLGSQPTTESVLSWLRTFAQASTQNPDSSRHHYFFLYCGAPDTDQAKNPLLEKVSAEIEKMRSAGQISPTMHFVPFTNQDADQIALLMARSDITITRSGGATSMELLSLHQAKGLPRRPGKCTLIHSEALTKTKDPAQLKNLQETLESFVDGVERQRGEEAVLNHEDWGCIEKEMISICRRLGVSQKEAKKIVSNIVGLYRGDGQTSQEIAASLVKSLEGDLHGLSREEKTRERSISRKMSKLKRKEPYRRFSEDELHRRAVEKLLRDEGIILWESKNAKYLQSTLGAHVVNPEYAQPLVARAFFGHGP